ncbi:MAG: conserved rane protein of unknown function [Parcubacteria group bacterium]|nr:conserved rane protein of unknown function [Parcubacteria group bacterium]
MKRMSRPLLILIVIILAMLGLADAWYLADTALTGASLTCNIAGLDGCNIVAQSPYSHILGIPLGVYGVVFYGLFLILAFIASKKPFRMLIRALLALGTIGLLVSAWFLYIQFVLIQALCVYCLASAGISFLLWGATLALWRTSPAHPRPLPPASV